MGNTIKSEEQIKQDEISNHHHYSNTWINKDGELMKRIADYKGFKSCSVCNCVENLKCQKCYQK